MVLRVYFLILWWAFWELSTVRGRDDFYYPLPPENNTFDVTRYGAVGNGITDDSKAFDSAWKAACQQFSYSAKVTVPSEQTFLVSRIEFSGPCEPHSITFEILGTIVAQPKSTWTNKKANDWLKFHGVDGLTVVGNGQGVIDGQGDSWWRRVDEARPTAMRFSRCNNIEIRGVVYKNSQKNHVSISECNNATVSGLHMRAPPKSPNTDGIDISSSTNIHIYNCTMETGDDCIAINGGTSYVTISEVVCGPGHGISIGSLGANGKYEEVEAINVSNCTFNGSTNGVRIKTWQGGSGFARNINFSDINFIGTDNPVIINQFYCPHKTCANQASAVQVSDVTYIGLRGTSISKNAAVSFRCSDTVPCTNIILDDVDIRSFDPNTSTTAVCINAHGTARSTASPIVDCLLK